MRFAFFMPLMAALATCVPDGNPTGDFVENDPAAHSGEFECAGGCETAPSMVEDGLTQEVFFALLDAVAQEPLGMASLSLETLLFHGDTTAIYLDQLGTGPLSGEQADFLRRELQRTQAKVSFRVIDDEGVIHASLTPTVVPLGEKQHVHLHTEGALGDVEAGGTVRRVGLHHVWSRW